MSDTSPTILGGKGLSQSPVSSQSFERNRSVSGGMIALLILLGLASRKFAWLLPSLLRKNLGDVLWATMVFALLGFVFPRLSILRVAVMAFLFTVAIEVSKFVHVPWFEAVRATVLGRLIFGYEFSWTNLGCYLLGIAFGAGWETGRNCVRLRRSEHRE